MRHIECDRVRTRSRYPYPSCSERATGPGPQASRLHPSWRERQRSDHVGIRTTRCGNEHGVTGTRCSARRLTAQTFEETSIEMRVWSIDRPFFAVLLTLFHFTSPPPSAPPLTGAARRALVPHHQPQGLLPGRHGLPPGGVPVAAPLGGATHAIVARSQKLVFGLSSELDDDEEDAISLPSSGDVGTEAMILRRFLARS